MVQGIRHYEEGRLRALSHRSPRPNFSNSEASGRPRTIHAAQGTTSNDRLTAPFTDVLELVTTHVTNVYLPGVSILMPSK